MTIFERPLNNFKQYTSGSLFTVPEGVSKLFILACGGGGGASGGGGTTTGSASGTAGGNTTITAPSGAVVLTFSGGAGGGGSGLNARGNNGGEASMAPINTFVSDTVTQSVIQTGFLGLGKAGGASGPVGQNGGYGQNGSAVAGGAGGTADAASGPQPGGKGGDAIPELATLDVTPGEVYTIVVGSGGNGSTGRNGSGGGGSGAGGSCFIGY